MSIPQRGLGRGLAALMSPQEKDENDTLQYIATSLLSPCLSQPRKTFDQTQLDELAQSIETKGIVQPLVVRPLSSHKYEIVAGERRWRAAQQIGLATLPVIVRNYSDAEAMTIALIENIQREDLNPMEEAEAFALLKEQYSLSQEELAASLGKSRSALANALRLLKLPEEIRALILENKISAAHGRTLLALENSGLQSELAKRIQEENLSVRQVENMVEYANTYNQLPEKIEVNEKNTKSSSRKIEKPKEFLAIQKQLRKEVHRGTSISGTWENGKISLPFSGFEEFNKILSLLDSEGKIPALLKDE